MWVNFTSVKPYVVRVFVGSINAISGLPMIEDADTRRRRDHLLQYNHSIQDYMTVPKQQWLDGIAVQPGVVRQFVATQVGSGESIEAQLTGKEEYAGILFAVTPRKSPSKSRGFEDRTRNLRLHIAPLHAGAFSVNVSPDDTVDDLKFRIETSQSMAPSHFDLRFQGAQLEGKRDSTLPDLH